MPTVYEPATNLLIAVVEQAIQDACERGQYDHKFFDSDSFAAILTLSGVNVDADSCRAAIRKRIAEARRHRHRDTRWLTVAVPQASPDSST